MAKRTQLSDEDLKHMVTSLNATRYASEKSSGEDAEEIWAPSAEASKDEAARTTS